MSGGAGGGVQLAYDDEDAEQDQMRPSGCVLRVHVLDFDLQSFCVAILPNIYTNADSLITPIYSVIVISSFAWPGLLILRHSY